MLAHVTLIIPAGYANVTLLWASSRFVTGRAVTVFGAGEDLGDDPTSLNTFAAQVYDATVEHLVPLLDNNAQFLGVEVDGPTTRAEQLGTVVGGSNQLSIVVNSALLVKKSNDRRGRRAQGRMFLPMIVPGEQVEENGIIVGSVVTTRQEALTDWYEDWQTASGVPMVILQNSEGASAPISPPPVVQQLIVDPKIATQRRRMRR